MEAPAQSIPRFLQPFLFIPLCPGWNSCPGFSQTHEAGRDVHVPVAGAVPGAHKSSWWNPGVPCPEDSLLGHEPPCFAEERGGEEAVDGLRQ